MERDVFIDKFEKAVPLKAEDISEALKKSINSTRKTNKRWYSSCDCNGRTF